MSFVAASVILVGCLHAVSGSMSTEVPVEVLVTAWRSRLQSSKSADMTMVHDFGGGVDRFSVFQSHWVPEQSDEEHQFDASILLRGDLVRFESVRWAMEEHGMSREQFGQTLQMKNVQRNNPSEFLPALYSFFENEAGERLDSQKFLRVFDGETLHDSWVQTAAQYPRVTVHRECEYGSRTWALLADERDASARLDSLNLCAAVLSLNPLNQRFIGIRPQQLEQLDGVSMIDGVPCMRFIESVPSSEVSRIFWLDSDKDFAVRRYVATFREDVTQIDISYKRSSQMGWIPVTWTVQSLHGDDPVRAFVRSFVTMIKHVDPVTTSAFAAPSAPPGSWVVDGCEGRQYIVKDDGASREVTHEDLYWRPTYDDLLLTNPGEVRSVVMSRSRARSHFVTPVQCAVGGLLLLAAAVFVSLFKRNRAKSSIDIDPAKVRK